MTALKIVSDAASWAAGELRSKLHHLTQNWGLDLVLGTAQVWFWSAVSLLKEDTSLLWIAAGLLALRFLCARPVLFAVLLMIGIEAGVALSVAQTYTTTVASLFAKLP
jgi:hypothetical protein